MWEFVTERDIELLRALKNGPIVNPQSVDVEKYSGLIRHKLVLHGHVSSPGKNSVQTGAYVLSLSNEGLECLLKAEEARKKERSAIIWQIINTAIAAAALILSAYSIIRQVC